MDGTRKRGIRATKEGLEKLQQAKALGRDDDGKPLTYERIAEKAHVDAKTVKRFFGGIGVDKDSAINIAKALNLDINEIIEQNEENPPPPPETDIDWCEVCGGVLAQQRENRRLRRQSTERGFELNVYVPLGLVERKQQQRRSGDVPLEKVCQVTEEEVITKEYDNNDFLQEVIAGQESKRIAIIGEPGAGKTTLLQATADWIFNTNKAEDNPKLDSHLNKGSFQNSKSLGLPICIPLGALQRKSLKDYLLQDWLEAALQFIEPDAVGVETLHATSLQKLFREGQVWLLLDGVDEMAVSSPVEALAIIREQLTDWVGCARVLLTCRLNVWDANVNNTLAGFETYRTLEFKPEQVEEFIRAWFKCAAGDTLQPALERGEPPQPPLVRGEKEVVSPLLKEGLRGEKEVVSPLLKEGLRGEKEVVSPLLKGGLRGDRIAEELLAKLKETGIERIQELVRSPLRLSLLCQIWYLQPGELPETKAGLYQRFTRYFYEWKQEQHNVSHQDDLIDELQAALGKLALAGMNTAARFRLPRKLARQEMGERLFNLACSLGWLNLVDRETKSDEAVYAFYHPTFQEYFSALGIDDWHFFLNHVPHNPTQGNYRIFQPQWKQVILLWLGRGDVAKEQKEAFIKALTEFEDGCNGCYFYGYRAYFLAATGITEFKDCILADEIVAKIVKWRVSHFNMLSTADAISEVARAVLPETDRTKAIAALVELIRTSEDEYKRRKAAESLGEIGRNNPTTIAVLVELIGTSKDEDNCIKAADSLGEIGEDNPTSIAALAELIGTSEDEDTRITAADSLNEIIPAAFAALFELVQESTRITAAESLGKIDKDNPTAIAALVELIRTSESKDHRITAAESLGKIDKDNPTAIAALVELIRSSEDDFILWRAAKSLGEIGRNNPTAIAALVELIRASEEESTRREAAEILAKMDNDNPAVIAALVELIHTSESEYIRSIAAYSLAKMDNDNPTAIAALVELIGTSKDEDNRWRAASSLKENGRYNSTVIAALVELIGTSESLFIPWQAAKSLGEIGRDNPTAIAALVELIGTSENEFIRSLAAYGLGEIGEDNPIVIAALVELIRNSDNDDTRWRAASSLAKIDADNPTAIAALVELIRNSDNNHTRQNKVIGLGEIVAEAHMAGVVTALKDYWSDDTYENEFILFDSCDQIIWKCAQTLPYPEFYKAWHDEENPESLTVGSTPFTQTLNLAELPSLLASEISNNPQLLNSIHLICIDGSKFIDADNPALDIYDSMLDLGFPEYENGEPETMQKLKRYWNSLRRNSDKRLVLVFYQNPTSPGRQEFSNTFLLSLSKFDGEICVISDKPNIPLQSFSPNQPNLIEDILAWLRAKGMEE